MQALWFWVIPLVGSWFHGAAVDLIVTDNDDGNHSDDPVDPPTPPGVDDPVDPPAPPGDDDGNFSDEIDDILYQEFYFTPEVVQGITVNKSDGRGQIEKVEGAAELEGIPPNWYIFIIRLAYNRPWGIDRWDFIKSNSFETESPAMFPNLTVLLSNKYHVNPYCEGNETWVDADGDNCTVYGEQDFCDILQNEGDGWKKEGDMYDYGVEPEEGILSAPNQCCQCGGGIVLWPDLWPTPSPSTTPSTPAPPSDPPVTPSPTPDGPDPAPAPAPAPEPTRSPSDDGTVSKTNAKLALLTITSAVIHWQM